MSVFRFRLQQLLDIGRALSSQDENGICTACGGRGIIENEHGVTACPAGMTRPCKPPATEQEPANG